MSKRVGTNYDKLLGYNFDNSFNITDKPTVWIPDTEKGYILGEVLSGKGTGKLKVKLGTGEQIDVEEKNVSDANPGKFDGVSDMSDLSYLNEASVFNNLKKRYENDLIHTYSGLFLVVINPYKWLQIYTEEIITIYQGKRRKEVHPHVYALADEAYRNMLTDRRNQSMLITGESGAGKTENTKKVIQYIATIAGRKGGVGKLEQQILEANPMLEAFGNAKTNKNDNSSRFGKFIRLQFNQGGVIVGTTIQSYLLEKSRVVGQGKGERNFHIFYQLIVGNDTETRKKYNLTELKDYNFLKGGDCLSVQSLDDKKEFAHTTQAMNVIGIDNEEQEGIYRVIAAILNLGNVEFEAQYGGEGCEVKNPEKFLAYASELLKVNPDKLRDAIIKPFITAGNERIQKHFSVEQAQYSLKALCKAIYERIFLWLIQKLNKTLASDSESYFIGVLDIAGFEIFEINSFEQLCINFTNEKLQQFFNQHMFTLEQEEYEREKIEWKFIDYGMDGQDTIDLIEKKPNSILSFLDEESIFPRATNKTLITKLHTLAGKSKKYLKVQFKDFNFKIVHYAGSVDYNVEGWIEKNKDPLQEDIEKCVKSSEEFFIANLFQDEMLNPRAAVLAKKLLSGNNKSSRGGSTGGSSRGGASFMTVSASYKEQLDDLMDTLRSTYPHFIRCIIPNLKKTPQLLNAPLVLEQLACNGVLEGIRISRKGYPNRLMYSEFVRRYYLLDPNVKRDDPNPHEASKTIMKNLDAKIKKDVILEEKGELYQFGITKIFFRHGVLAKLEEYRELKLGQMVVSIQSGCRAWLARSAFKKLGKQTHAAAIIKRNVQSWLDIRDWKWWVLFQKIKPLIPQMKFDEEIENLKKEVKTLKEELEKTQNDLKTTSDKFGKAKNDLDKTLNELEDLERKHSELNNKRIQLDEENSNLNKEIDELDEDIRNLNKTKTLQEDNIKKLEENLRNTQNDLENTKKTTSEKIRQLERDLKEAKETANNSSDDNSNLKNQLSKLQSDLENAKLDIGDEQDKLEKTKKILNNEIEDLRHQLGEETDEKQKLDLNVKTLQTKYDDLTNDNNELQEKFDELDIKIKKGGILSNEQKTQMNEMDQNLKKLVEKNKNLETKLQEAETEFQKKEELYQNLQRDYKKLENENNNLHDDVNELKKREESSKQRYDQKLKQLALERDTALEDFEKAQYNLKQLQGEIDDLKEELEQQTNKTKVLDEKRKEFDKKYDELQNEVDQEKTAKENIEKEKKKSEIERDELRNKLKDALENQGEGSNEKQTQQIDELGRQLSNEKRYRQREEEVRKSNDLIVSQLEKELEELRRKLALSERNAKRAEEEFEQIRVLSENYTSEVKEFLDNNKKNRNTQDK
eukprot:TRINITY_DN35_c0_g1_i4.p1 TRINITY_DN35_c0_g1~~TRINITY_DN35_c0_g1_i4.p1  ORF type:complete len:1364 (+),score=604.46 TRINITY_DN35_c0_g1_i4:37-4128(+)